MKTSIKFLTLLLGTTFLLTSCNINVQDGDGKVNIGLDGIKVESKDGEKVNIGLDGIDVQGKN